MHTQGAKNIENIFYVFIYALKPGNKLFIYLF